ncbi:MAG: Beta-lactamase class C-like and penicillin binding proteins (PBPs) superfamily, partial [uncultured Thermomicrobiales bacterium]
GRIATNDGNAGGDRARAARCGGAGRGVGPRGDGLADGAVGHGGAGGEGRRSGVVGGSGRPDPGGAAERLGAAGGAGRGGDLRRKLRRVRSGGAGRRAVGDQERGRGAGRDRDRGRHAGARRHRRRVDPGADPGRRGPAGGGDHGRLAADDDQRVGLGREHGLPDLDRQRRLGGADARAIGGIRARGGLRLQHRRLAPAVGDPDRGHGAGHGGVRRGAAVRSPGDRAGAVATVAPRRDQRRVRPQPDAARHGEARVSVPERGALGRRADRSRGLRAPLDGLPERGRRHRRHAVRSPMVGDGGDRIRGVLRPGLRRAVHLRGAGSGPGGGDGGRETGTAGGVALAAVGDRRVGGPGCGV